MIPFKGPTYKQALAAFRHTPGRRGVKPKPKTPEQIAFENWREKFAEKELAEMKAKLDALEK